MPRQCAATGKKTVSGRRITRRGLPKKTGGIGLNTTGISKRTFKPNLQRVRIRVNGQVKRVRLSAKAIRDGKFEKA